MMHQAALALLVAAPAAHAQQRWNSTETSDLSATCQEVRYREPNSPDGDYILQCSPADVPFDVYCAGMNGTAGAAPREYLTLPAGETLNFAEYLCGDECKSGNPDDSTVHTTFSKIRINPCTLFVDIQDYTFATSRGRVTHVDSGNGAVTVYTEQPYGTAGSCEGGQGSGPGGEGGPAGKANVDVRGTPFSINTTWVPHGAQAFGSATDAGQGSHKSYDLTGGGFCGLFVPEGWSEWNNATSFSALQLVREGAGPPTPPPAPPGPRECTDVSGRWKATTEDLVTIAQPSGSCDITATHGAGDWFAAEGAFFDRWNLRVDFEYPGGANDTLTGHLNGCDPEQCPAGSTITWSSKAQWTKHA